VVVAIVAAVTIHWPLGVDSRGASRGASVRVLVACAAAMILPSAFWYVRNLVVEGNAFAPLGLHAGGGLPGGWIRQQFQFVPETSYWWIQPLIDRQSGGTYTGSAGFGAAFGMLHLPGLAACLITALSTKTAGEFRRTRMILLLLILTGIASWWFGGHHLPRFLLPVVALMCAPFALVFENVRRHARTVLLVLVAAALLFSVAETQRIVYKGGNVTWSNLRGIDRDEFYKMPGIIYELPPLTRILLLEMVEDEYYFRTFRYPLAGGMPGNDVVMEADPALELNLSQMSPVEAHQMLLRNEIDYVFFRVFLDKPFRTSFDDHPQLFEPEYKETQRVYNWYRRVAGDYSVTRMYRVRRD
jgi:hypothetical protein